MIPTLIILIGTSGAGKSTIAQRLMDTGAVLNRIKSNTTRRRRVHEGNDEYIFVPSIDINDFVETTEYAGNTYGLSKSEADKVLEFSSNLAILDLHGSKTLTRYYKEQGAKVNIITVFIDASNEVLRQRLEARGKDFDVRRVKQWDVDREAKAHCDSIMYNNDNGVTNIFNRIARIVGEPTYATPMACDGACSSNGAAGAAWFDGFNYYSAHLESCSTNNQAEYMGLISLLEHLKTIGFEGKATIHMDSQLVAYQVLGKYRVKNALLLPYNVKAKKLYEESGLDIKWVRREDPIMTRVDELAKEAKQNAN